MADESEKPETLKKQDAALKQMETVLARLSKPKTKASAAELQKSLSTEKDD